MSFAEYKKFLDEKKGKTSASESSGSFAEYKKEMEQKNRGYEEAFDNTDMPAILKPYANMAFRGVIDQFSDRRNKEPHLYDFSENEKYLQNDPLPQPTSGVRVLDKTSDILDTTVMPIKGAIAGFAENDDLNFLERLGKGYEWGLQAARNERYIPDNYMQSLIMDQTFGANDGVGQIGDETDIMINAIIDSAIDPLTYLSFGKTAVARIANRSALAAAAKTAAKEGITKAGVKAMEKTAGIPVAETAAKIGSNIAEYATTKEAVNAGVVGGVVGASTIDSEDNLFTAGLKTAAGIPAGITAKYGLNKAIQYGWSNDQAVNEVMGMMDDLREMGIDTDTFKAGHKITKKDIKQYKADLAKQYARGTILENEAGLSPKQQADLWKKNDLGELPEQIAKPADEVMEDAGTEIFDLAKKKVKKAKNRAYKDANEKFDKVVNKIKLQQDPKTATKDLPYRNDGLFDGLGLKKKVDQYWLQHSPHAPKITMHSDSAGDVSIPLIDDVYMFKTTRQAKADSNIEAVKTYNNYRHIIRNFEGNEAAENAYHINMQKLSSDTAKIRSKVFTNLLKTGKYRNAKGKVLPVTSLHNVVKNNKREYTEVFNKATRIANDQVQKVVDNKLTKIFEKHDEVTGATKGTMKRAIQQTFDNNKNMMVQLDEARKAQGFTDDTIGLTAHHPHVFESDQQAADVIESLFESSKKRPGHYTKLMENNKNKIKGIGESVNLPDKFEDVPAFVKENFEDAQASLTHRAAWQQAYSIDSSMHSYKLLTDAQRKALSASAQYYKKPRKILNVIGRINRLMKIKQLANNYQFVSNNLKDNSTKVYYRHGVKAGTKTFLDHMRGLVDHVARESPVTRYLDDPLMDITKEDKIFQSYVARNLIDIHYLNHLDNAQSVLDPLHTKILGIKDVEELLLREKAKREGLTFIDDVMMAAKDPKKIREAIKKFFKGVPKADEYIAKLAKGDINEGAMGVISKMMPGAVNVTMEANARYAFYHAMAEKLIKNGIDEETAFDMAAKELDDIFFDFAKKTSPFEDGLEDAYMYWSFDKNNHRFHINNLFTPKGLARTGRLKRRMPGSEGGERDEEGNVSTVMSPFITGKWGKVVSAPWEDDMRIAYQPWDSKLGMLETITYMDEALSDDALLATWNFLIAKGNTAASQILQHSQNRNAVYGTPYVPGPRNPDVYVGSQGMLLLGYDAIEKSLTGKEREIWLDRKGNLRTSSASYARIAGAMGVFPLFPMDSTFFKAAKEIVDSFEKHGNRNRFWNEMVTNILGHAGNTTMMDSETRTKVRNWNERSNRFKEKAED